MYRLGTIVKDRATGLEGMLTHFARYADGNEFYLFQPRGLNPKNGQPLKTLWVEEGRIEGGEVVPSEEMPNLYLEVLGTEVEDRGTGFKGTAVEVQLHTNGCVHFFVQPAGRQETGDAIQSCNFDIRRLVGPAIKPLSHEEKVESMRRHPSPEECGSSCPGTE